MISQEFGEMMAVQAGQIHDFLTIAFGDTPSYGRRLSDDEVPPALPQYVGWIMVLLTGFICTKCGVKATKYVVAKAGGVMTYQFIFVRKCKCYSVCKAKERVL